MSFFKGKIPQFTLGGQQILGEYLEHSQGQLHMEGQ